MSTLSHQLDMTLMRERLSAMEALLAEHKIKVPKPIKNGESTMMASMRINQRKLFAARALERLRGQLQFCSPKVKRGTRRVWT